MQIENEKFINHPYFDDFGVINAAFNELIQHQQRNFHTLRDYKGAIADSAIEQLNWENKRIEEVKKIVLNKLFNE